MLLNPSCIEVGDDKVGGGEVVRCDESMKVKRQGKRRVGRRV